MPKYSTRTYGRNRSKESQISREFDEIQKSQNSNSTSTSENTFTRKLSRKSPWSRTSRVVELSVSNLAKEATVDGSKTNKRRKLDVIEEKDPFAFDEDDVTTQGSKKIVSQSNAITKQRITNQASTTEFTDKSTDDEAYSSSQEWSETSSQGGEKKVSSNYRKKPTGVSLSIFCWEIESK